MTSGKAKPTKLSRKRRQPEKVGDPDKEMLLPSDDKEVEPTSSKEGTTQTILCDAVELAGEKIAATVILAECLDQIHIIHAVQITERIQKLKQALNTSTFNPADVTIILNSLKGHLRDMTTFRDEERLKLQERFPKTFERIFSHSDHKKTPTSLVH